MVKHTTKNNKNSRILARHRPQTYPGRGLKCGYRGRIIATV